MAQKIVKVHVNRQVVELHEPEGTVGGLVAAAGFEGPDWDVFEIHGEGDPTGGNKLDLGQAFHFANGQHFRVVPGNRNLGA